MKRFPQILLLLSAGSLLGACNFFTQPADLQTANLENDQAQTQIIGVRATATVNADHLQVTLENAQTAVSSVDQESTRIAATLIAQGMPFVDPGAITPVAPTDAPQANPSQADVSQTAGSPAGQIANPLLTPSAPQINGQGSARGDSPLVPATPTPQGQAQVQPTTSPRGNSSGASLTHITLTEQVGSDDCPVKAATSFSSRATDIYVTMMANNVQPTNTLTADFMHEGQEVKTYSWSPKFTVRGACIWFHMPSSDATFTPGNWTVTLTIDGAPIGAPIPFTITGAAPVQINVTPDATG